MRGGPGIAGRRYRSMPAPRNEEYGKGAASRVQWQLTPKLLASSQDAPGIVVMNASFSLKASSRTTRSGVFAKKRSKKRRTQIQVCSIRIVFTSVLECHRPCLCVGLPIRDDPAYLTERVFGRQYLVVCKTR